MNKLISDFIAERTLLEIPRELVVDDTKWFEIKKNLVKYLPYITLTAEYDPVTGTAPTQYENGRKMVSHKDTINFITDIVLLNNADAVYTVEAGAQKKIAQIFADVETVAGGANKDFTVAIVKSMGPAISLLDAMVTGAIAVVPGTNASIAMFQSGPTWLNNAGVIGNEDTNVVGIILEAGDTITATWTNKVGDDRARLSVGEIDLPVI